jgi:hypothetical protein
MLFPGFNNYFASNTIGETMLIRNRRCSSLWLPIGIHYGVICGCEYPSSSLLLVWIDEQIYWLCGPNWLPNSMLLNLFWVTRILDSCSCGWSINVPTTFYNSTYLTIPPLMWKGKTGQSMIACPSSQNAQTLESNLIISKSLDSWSCVLTVCLIWSNPGFLW